MTTEADVYNALRYCRVVTNSDGSRMYFDSAVITCYTATMARQRCGQTALKYGISTGCGTALAALP